MLFSVPGARSSLDHFALNCLYGLSLEYLGVHLN
jgi:hypothetical protein